MNLKNYLITTIFLVYSFCSSAQVLLSEDFSGGFPAGWTNVDIASVPGQEVIFQHTTNPNAVESAAVGDPERSTFFAPGALDGFIWADSDRGLSEPPTNIHITALTTPAINCSAANQVFFSMYALIGSFYLDVDENALLRVSTDNVNWSEYELFPNLTTDENWSENPTFIALNISEVAANEPNVYLQLQWTGGWEYFMAIDDFLVSSTDPRPAANIRINDFTAISPNVLRPRTQVEPVGFIADIENIGSEEQTNIKLTIDVRQSNNILFTDQLDYGDMTPDQLTENVLFENQFDVPAVESVYQANYSLSFDNDEEQENQNLLSYTFPIAVTDTLFSKEDGVTRGVDPVENNQYTYGCVYHINNDNIDDRSVYATSITFGVTNADEIAGEFANILLLEWDGDVNENFLAESTEYTTVGLNSYLFTGNEDLSLITIAADEDGPVPLIAGKYYIAAIQFTSTDPEQRYILQASEDYDYQAMQFYTDTINAPRWASALDIGNQGDFNLVGFGFDIVPIARLGVTLGPVSTQELQLPKGAVRLFPNPASTSVNVSFDLAEETSGQLLIYDSKGALIQTQQLNNIQHNQISINTQNLPSGIYKLHLITPLGVQQLPLSVQH